MKIIPKEHASHPNIIINNIIYNNNNLIVVYRDIAICVCSTNKIMSVCSDRKLDVAVAESYVK